MFNEALGRLNRASPIDAHRPAVQAQPVRSNALPDLRGRLVAASRNMPRDAAGTKALQEDVNELVRQANASDANGTQAEAELWNLFTYAPPLRSMLAEQAHELCVAAYESPREDRHPSPSLAHLASSVAAPGGNIANYLNNLLNTRLDTRKKENLLASDRDATANEAIGATSQLKNIQAHSEFVTVMGNNALANTKEFGKAAKQAMKSGERVAVMVRNGNPDSPGWITVVAEPINRDAKGNWTAIGWREFNHLPQPGAQEMHASVLASLKFASGGFEPRLLSSQVDLVTGVPGSSGEQCQQSLAQFDQLIDEFNNGRQGSMAEALAASTAARADISLEDRGVAAFVARGRMLAAAASHRTPKAATQSTPVTRARVEDAGSLAMMRDCGKRLGLTVSKESGNPTFQSTFSRLSRAIGASAKIKDPNASRFTKDLAKVELSHYDPGKQGRALDSATSQLAQAQAKSDFVQTQRSLEFPSFAYNALDQASGTAALAALRTEPDRFLITCHRLAHLARHGATREAREEAIDNLADAAQLYRQWHQDKLTNIDNAINALRQEAQGELPAKTRDINARISDLEKLKKNTLQSGALNDVLTLAKEVESNPDAGADYFTKLPS